MNATVDTNAERAALIDRLQGALDALESGDEAAWKREVDHLAALRTRPMMQGLSRLARELGQALGELPTLPEEAGELDDACSRLDHVVEMTEKASHRTLDLVEECRLLANQLRDGGLNQDQGALMDKMRHNLTELSLAQSYQDLSGQIIRRVAGIVRRVHERLWCPRPATEKHRAEERRRRSCRSCSQGPDRHAVSQDDADDLLSGLGL